MQRSRWFCEFDLFSLGYKNLVRFFMRKVNSYSLSEAELPSQNFRLAEKLSSLGFPVGT